MQLPPATDPTRSRPTLLRLIRWIIMLLFIAAVVIVLLVVGMALVAAVIALSLIVWVVRSIGRARAPIAAGESFSRDNQGRENVRVIRNQ